MSKPKITEAQLAEEIISYLEDYKWEVYQEVSHNGGSRCDIVAVRGKIQWAIECKLSFGFSVLSQAFNWKKYCHYVSVAVPRGYDSVGEHICKQNNIGILVVDQYRLFDKISYNKYYESLSDDDKIDYDKSFSYNTTKRNQIHVNEHLVPKLFRQAKGLKLVEEQKHWAKAGSTSGCEYYTPFKKTVQNMINIVTGQGDMEYTELIKKSEHHYRNDTTAKSCLRSYIGTDVIPELEIKYVDNKMYVGLIKVYERE